MRRKSVIAGILAVISLIAIVSGAGAIAAHKSSPAKASSKRITGTWTGTITGNGPAEPIEVTVHSGERKGTWSESATCHGTLALKDISEGFHHFNRIAAAGTSCSGGSGGGVDCLKRDGSRVLDEYQPDDSSTWGTGLLTKT